MSAAPESAAWIPELDPPPWTLIDGELGWLCMYRSASNSAKGSTDVEPARVIWAAPERPVPRFRQAGKKKRLQHKAIATHRPLTPFAATRQLMPQVPQYRVAHR